METTFGFSVYMVTGSVDTSTAAVEGFGINGKGKSSQKFKFKIESSEISV